MESTFTCTALGGCLSNMLTIDHLLLGKESKLIGKACDNSQSQKVNQVTLNYSQSSHHVGYHIAVTKIKTVHKTAPLL